LGDPAAQKPDSCKVQYLPEGVTFATGATTIRVSADRKNVLKGDRVTNYFVALYINLQARPIMKRFFLFLILTLLSLPVALSAQDVRKPSWRKTDDGWTRKNSITLSTSVMNFSSYNAMSIFPLTIEYDRALRYNLSVSAIGIFAPLEGAAATDTHTVREHFWFAGAKANYNLPVVHNWLYLRIGLGMGVGYHIEPDEFSGGIWGKPEPPVQRWVKPHFIVDMYWVFRAARWLELRFAPGFISPSQFIVGSKLDRSYIYYYYNAMGTLGATVRF
jgi:hypothetical protein